MHENNDAQPDRFRCPVCKHEGPLSAFGKDNACPACGYVGRLDVVTWTDHEGRKRRGPVRMNRGSQ